MGCFLFRNTQIPATASFDLEPYRYCGQIHPFEQRKKLGKLLQGRLRWILEPEVDRTAPLFFQLEPELLDDLLYKAIKTNRVEFAAQFLENGIILSKFLTYRCLLKLYNDVNDQNGTDTSQTCLMINHDFWLLSGPSRFVVLSAVA